VCKSFSFAFLERRCERYTLAVLKKRAAQETGFPNLVQARKALKRQAAEHRVLDPLYI
jgi:hypothetical protein